MADLIKKTGSLLLHHEINDIIAKVSLLIKEIHEFEALKLNHDLTLFVLNNVTNMVKHHKVIDIEAVSIQILTRVFSLNESEVASLKQQIDYLQASGAVKKISSYEVLLSKLKKKFSK